MSDAKQLKAIQDIGRLLKGGGVLVASCVACNAGILTKDINPEPGRYMAKVTIDVEKGGVDNTIEEFISLGEEGARDYTPQAYYVLEGDVYTEKSCGELLTLGEAGRTECYRYVHHIDEHEEHDEPMDEAD